MEVEELRIGNLVKVNETGADLQRNPTGIIEVLSINEKGIGIYVDYDELGVDFTIHEVYPIPLTEEWLLRFGFKKTNSRKLEGSYFS